MKKYIYIIGLIICASFLISNSAQPGVWNAGGSGSFTLLYPEDSVAYKKIQMKTEDIYMQLYKGFAVVKGNYYFKNTATDTLKIKVGYPINNVFENIKYSEYVNEVTVDGLYKIKGLVNGKEANVYQKPNKDNDNWYVWEIAFPPNKITEFSVFFLVNTNNARTIKGYNSEKKNAFIYLIETGSLWKSPIEKGNFYIQLKDEVSIDNAKASSPTNLVFDEENTVLMFSLEDYGKTPDKNFVITYSNKIEDFDFKGITEKSNHYFTTIEAFSKTDFSTFSFTDIILPNAYEVGGVGNLAIGTVYYFLIYGIPALIIVVIIIIILFLYKKYKKRT